MKKCFIFVYEMVIQSNHKRGGDIGDKQGKEVDPKETVGTCHRRPDRGRVEGAGSTKQVERRE